MFRSFKIIITFLVLFRHPVTSTTKNITFSCPLIRIRNSLKVVLVPGTVKITTRGTVILENYFTLNTMFFSYHSYLTAAHAGRTI